MSSKKHQVVVATDGSCLGGPGGPIGWGWARDDGHWLSNGFWTGTNQRAELWAIISALLAHPDGSLKIQSDSQYALNVASSWAASWERRGWVRKGDKPILNLDLVIPLYDLVSTRTDQLEFEWVKGHSGHELNELADKYAVAGAQRARAVSSDEESLTLYRDSKGRESNKFQHRMMVDIISGATDTTTTITDDVHSLFEGIELADHLS